MAADLVNSATSKKLTEMDWTKNIEICELVARDQRLAKDVVKAIKKRLGNKSPNVQLYAVMLSGEWQLLEMLMNNIGEHVHRQVIEASLIPVLVKIVKKKSEFPVRERIFLLLDATQTSLGGASGKFPQYYNAYYELVSAGVKFPQRPHSVPSNHTSSEARQNNLTVREVAYANQDRVAPREKPQVAPESSIMQKARAALEVLREVLEAVDAQNPEGAKDEFTLDLVEQCSFQKQQVMHLVMSSRDERLVSQAIELNEQLGKVLARHDALLFGQPPSTTNHIDHNGTLSKGHNRREPVMLTSALNHVDHEESEEEEEAEQLFS
ncbi:TOM1-like protein 5 [Ancistrocladus abbreviatus]